MFKTTPDGFFIVVEGPDGSGKSTLIQKLEILYGIKAHHNGGPPETVSELVRRLNESPSESFILDRWSAISEQVYGSLGTREKLLSDDILTDAIKHHRPLIIYCRPPFDTLIANKELLKRKKAHKSEEHCQNVSDNLVKIILAYDELMTELKNQDCLVLTYDYTNG